jgi:hypothetical protein
VVLGFDSANPPACAGMNQTALKGVARFTVRNQVANLPGASIPQTYGETYRQMRSMPDLTIFFR